GEHAGAVRAHPYFADGARDEVALAVQLRYPERVDHVHRPRLDPHGPAHRDVQLVGCTQAAGGHGVLVLDLPPPLVARHDDAEHVVVRHGPYRARRREVRRQEDEQQDDGAERRTADEYAEPVLGRFLPAAPPHRERERGHDDDVHGRQHPEGEPPEALDGAGLRPEGFGHRAGLALASSLASARAGHTSRGVMPASVRTYATSFHTSSGLTRPSNAGIPFGRPSMIVRKMFSGSEP